MFGRSSASSRPVARWWALGAAGLAMMLTLAAVLWNFQGSGRELRLAFRAADQGRWETARDHATKWLAAEPDSAEGHFVRARAAFALGEPGVAIREIGEARRLGHAPDALDRLLGFTFVRAGRYADAEPLLANVFRTSTAPDLEVDEALARVYLHLYKLDQATAVLERWIEEAPGDARPYFWLTEAEKRSGVDSEVIVGHLRDALERDPGLDAARFALAEELRAAKRPDEADAEYHTYLEKHPDDARALLGGGISRLESGHPDDGALLLERSLAVDPNNVETWRQLARIESDAGQLDAALGRLNRAVELDPYDLESVHARSLVLARLGRADEAKRDRETADRIRADRDALDALRTALAKSPGDPETRTKIAQWMLDHGQERAGLGWTQAILSENPNYRPVHELLATYHAKKGEHGLANYHRLHAGSPQ